MAQYDGSIRILTEISTKAAQQSLGTLAYTIKGTAKEISSLRSKMDALKGQKFYTDDYKKLQSDLETAKKEFSDLIARQNEWEKMGITSGGAWNSLNEKIADTRIRIEDISEKMQSLEEAGKAFTLGENTAQYATYERQIGYEQAAMEKMVSQYQELEKMGDPYARLSQSVSDLNKRLSSVLHPIESMKSAFASAVENMKARAAGIAATIINGIAHPFQTARKTASSAVTTIKELISGIASAVKKTGKAISSVTSILKKATSSMFGFGKSAKSSNNMLQSGFKNILKYGLGIRSFYALINKLRTAIKEGFGNLAQYSDPVNSALSSLKSSLIQLKNSLATAFAPILTAVAPALTALIDMVSRAATAVGMLIAALTGQKTFVKATKTQQGYADSLKGTSKVAKDANKQLSSLDKLNNLTTSDSGDGGGGGGGGAGVGNMFETVDIPSKIKDLADMIKKAWEKADFTEIGALIGTKLKDALDNIPWDKIQATAAKVGKSLATLIGGFVSVPGLGYSIGNTIAQAINTALIGLNEFAKWLPWDMVGKFIAEGINGALINIDWETALSAASLFGIGFADLFNNALTPTVFANIGYTIGMGLNTALTFANDFITKFEWHNFGTNIGNGLNVAIQTLDTGLLGKTIGNLVDGLFQTLKAFIDKTDWKSLGKKITTEIAAFFGEIDWGTIGGAISSFGIGIFNFLTGLIQGIDWSKLPQSIIDGISDFFSNFNYEGVFSAFGEHIGATIAAGIDLLSALGEVLSSAWDDVVEYFSGYIEESGGNIILGLYNGIIAAINGIGDWIYENIFSPFIEGFKSAFGINSPSTVMEEQGNFIMQGLLNGITALIDSVVEKFTEIKDKILEKWEEVKTNTAEKWENIKSDLSEKWENLKSDASTSFENIKTDILNKWEETRTNTEKKWGEIKKDVSDKWEEIKKDSKGSAKNIKDKIVEAWEGLESKTKEIWDGIKKCIKSPINAIIGFINKMISGVVSGINTLIGMLNNLSVSNPFTGEKIMGFDIPTLTAPQIPKLATGTVIPPNREFLAVLGDQKHGTNIEAPLSTIEDAVENVLRKNGSAGGVKELTIHVPVEVDGRVLFDLIKKFDLEQYKSTGRPSFQI